MPPSAQLTHLVQRVNDNIRFVIPETLFALTIFREQLGIKVVVLFAGVLFTKFFHWVMSVRVDEVHAAVVLGFSSVHHLLSCAARSRCRCAPA